MSPVTINDILLAVQKVTRVGIRDLKGDGQFPHIRAARGLACFVAADCFNKSTEAIGRVLGRDAKSVRDVLMRRRRCAILDPDLIDRVEVEALTIASARIAGHINYTGYPFFADGKEGC
jgi:hypothetical protein